MSVNPSPLSGPPYTGNRADPMIAEALRSAAPFTGLADEAIASIAESASVRHYEAGETILAMGQFDGSEFLIVRTGRLKAARMEAGVSSMLIENVRAGEFFGLAEAMLGGDQHMQSGVTISAEAASEIVAIDAESFRRIAAQRPSLTRALMLHFARKLLGDSRVDDGDSPERRVLAALSSLVERDAASAEWRIARMPKHRELADRAGVDETEAATAVAKLIQSGVARRNYPGLVIDDIAGLNRLAR